MHIWAKNDFSIATFYTSVSMEIAVGACMTNHSSEGKYNFCRLDSLDRPKWIRCLWKNNLVSIINKNSTLVMMNLNLFFVDALNKQISIFSSSLIPIREILNNAILQHYYIILTNFLEPWNRPQKPHVVYFVQRTSEPWGFERERLGPGTLFRGGYLQLRRGHAGSTFSHQGRIYCGKCN